MSRGDAMAREGSGTKKVRSSRAASESLYFQGLDENHAQSIIGATLNRRNGSAH